MHGMAARHCWAEDAWDVRASCMGSAWFELDHGRLFQVNDTVMLDLETGKIKDFAKFDVGNVCMVTGGHNNGRVGVVVRREKHKGAFDIVHIEDNAGNTFATRITNVFVIGKGKTPLISLPKVGGARRIGRGKGVGWKLG